MQQTNKCTLVKYCPCFAIVYLLVCCINLNIALMHGYGMEHFKFVKQLYLWRIISVRTDEVMHS